MRSYQISPISGDKFSVAKLSHPYRYLCILQVFEAQAFETRSRLRKTYLKRLGRIWRLRLTAVRKTEITNTWVFRSFLPWPRDELQALNRRTRFIMKMNKSHHPNASKERVHIPRRHEGGGVTSLTHVWEQDVFSTTMYLTMLPGTLEKEMVDYLRQRGPGSFCFIYGSFQMTDLLRFL